MQREVIKLETGVPRVVHLKNEGIRKQNGRGPYFDYSVDDGAVLWLPPEGHAVLQHIGAQAGDLVEILKDPKGFRARLVSDAAEPHETAHHGHQSPCALERPQRKRETKRPGFPARAYCQPEPRSNGHANGAITRAEQPPANGNTQQPVRVIGENQTPDDYYAEQYVRCFRSALQAAALCVEEAKKYNYPVAAPTLEDVRTIATTFFIQSNREGGAR